MNLKDRAENKAFAKIVGLEREIRELYVLLETNQIGSLSVEQFENMIEFKKRELDTWKFILNRVQ